MPRSLSPDHAVAQQILDALHERKGVGDELDRIKSDDLPLYEEIVNEIANIIYWEA